MEDPWILDHSFYGPKPPVFKPSDANIVSWFDSLTADKTSE